MTHLRIWKFRPPHGGEQEFARLYGADGVWPALFATAGGYLGTELYGPDQPGGWWLTIDRWSSAGDFAAFSDTHAERYCALDEELEGVAGEEEFVGAFEQAE